MHTLCKCIYKVKWGLKGRILFDADFGHLKYVCTLMLWYHLSSSFHFYSDLDLDQRLPHHDRLNWSCPVSAKSPQWNWIFKCDELAIALLEIVGHCDKRNPSIHNGLQKHSVLIFLFCRWTMVKLRVKST